MTPAARLAAAIDLLAALEAEPRKPADAVAHDFFRARRFIGAGDRRAVSERAWGVVRQRLRLAWWLARVGAATGAGRGPQRGRTGAPALDPAARLLAAAHMLLVERAALSAVGGAFNGDRYAPPPLNAEEQGVLRALAGQPLLVPEMPEGVRLNLPDWALPGLRARFGDGLAEEAAALDGPAPLDLRANLLKTTREGAAAALAAEGVETEPTPLSPWGLRVPAGRVPIAGTQAFRAGLVEVQDEGSQIVAALADARPGQRVCDLCAGAGGKTLAMAAAMGNRGRITACDVSAARLEGAVRRLRRAGVANAERHLLVAGDKWAKRRAGGFDRVLVDAPCTGSGTWRRNPDARTRTDAEDLRELLAKQGEILSMSADLVRPDGRLIYATCSLLPEENEGQVDAFLARRPDFAPLPLAEAWARAGLTGPPPAAGRFLALSPARHGTDGFFAAVLHRATV